jgi:nitroreductase
MSIVSRLIPQKYKVWLFLLRESYLDTKRYFRSAEFPHEEQRKYREHLESEIMRRYHVIEKGLSMPEFRPRFGVEMVSRLVDCLGEWDALKRCTAEDSENNQICSAQAVLVAYAERHRELGVDVSDFLSAEILDGIDTENTTSGGTKPFEGVRLEDGAAFQRMVNSRVSVRDFDIDQQPSHELIQRAIEMAVRSPSVCNRQTWRVHAFEGERAQKMLSLQNGNRGFGHRIPTVLIVTSDMRFFGGAIERYQSWVDGGMFSMTLLLALHSIGLGAVALNWSVLNVRDNAIRKVAGIPYYERIIMFIGCGYPAEGVIVANSQRRPAETFIRWDDDAS